MNISDRDLRVLWIVSLLQGGKLGDKELDKRLSNAPVFTAANSFRDSVASLRNYGLYTKSGGGLIKLKAPTTASGEKHETDAVDGQGKAE